MGRLFQKTVTGNKTLAYFGNDKVKCRQDTAKWLAQYNNIGQIFMQTPLCEDAIIANCDISGNIRKGSSAYGWILAKCEDGIVFEGDSADGKVLAHFEGDMYGAAAAVVVTLLAI